MFRGEKTVIRSEGSFLLVKYRIQRENGVRVGYFIMETGNPPWPKEWQMRHRGGLFCGGWFILRYLAVVIFS